MEELAPAGEEEAREAVADALARARPLEVLGAGTRRGLGRPVEAEALLSARKLTGVIFYEPAELVLSARAGTKLSDVTALLAQHGQELAFEPIDHSLFYAGESGGGTIGGVIGANASGPRRVKAGAARDHLLGFRAVTGRGEVIKSGGRVMKNVTGYDLCKLVAGSYGTLVFLTEATLKVLPRAEAEATVLIADRDEARGLALLREASGLPLDVSGLALTPALAGAPPTAALRLEAPAPSLQERCDALLAHLSARGAVEVLREGDSRAYWADVRDAQRMRATEGQIWRLSVAPDQGGPAVQAIKQMGTPVAAYSYDWAGGLVWLAVESAPDAHAQAIRAVVDRLGGHAVLMRADADARRSVAPFHPQPPPLAALTKRVKESFDPLRVLNRGRMRADL